MRCGAARSARSRARGATVIFRGAHATLYPDEALTLGGAHAVVKGDGDEAWPLVLEDAARATLQLAERSPVQFAATADIADRAGLAFAQFVMLTPYPGTVDFAAWERRLGCNAGRVAGIRITGHWLISQAQRPKVYTPHPVM